MNTHGFCYREFARSAPRALALRLSFEPFHFEARWNSRFGRATSSPEFLPLDETNESHLAKSVKRYFKFLSDHKRGHRPFLARLALLALPIGREKLDTKSLDFSSECYEQSTMVQLKSRTTSPPDGFIATEPKTGWNSRKACPETRWDFKALCKEVREYRRRHPELGLSADPSVVESDVDKENALRIASLPNAQMYVTMPGMTPYSPPPISAPHVKQVPHRPGSGVSAVVPILRPSAGLLNKCISSILSQVDEIVITQECDGELPIGTISDPRIKHVIRPSGESGFGRNVNFGFKHTKGKYVLIINDDVWLEPDAVAKMLECMKPGVGIVGHLLKYPDFTIYHGGKRNIAGRRGGHLHFDYKEAVQTITQTMEMDNTNGASILVRADAFNQIGGFDEDFRFYLEDDDLCLRLRQAGWRLWYTPFAVGTHVEHESTRHVPEIEKIVSDSNDKYHSKWKWYNDLNRGNPGLGKFDLEPAKKTVLVYIYALGGASGYKEKAIQFVNSYAEFPPLAPHDTVVVCNGVDCNHETRTIFDSLPNVTYLHHDDSGWDIGGYQLAARTIPCDLMVFCGGHTYFRKTGWMQRIWQVYKELGDTLYGSTGNQGDLKSNVYPHVRTTGFWCSPSLLSKYPHLVTQQGGGGERYQMEHGLSCFTNWVRNQGLKPWIVGWDCVKSVLDCDSMPNGFHQGDQSNILIGDRLTAPPYYSHP